MRASVRNYMDAAKRRRLEEDSQKGFSLIELIVVILVLGILIAVAFPIFGAVQKNAKIGALEAAAAEGATVAASEVAAGSTFAQIQAAVIAAAPASAEYSLALTAPASAATLSNICVTATADNPGSLYDATIAATDTDAGPGC